MEIPIKETSFDQFREGQKVTINPVNLMPIEATVQTVNVYRYGDINQVTLRLRSTVTDYNEYFYETPEGIKFREDSGSISAKRHLIVTQMKLL